MSFNRKKCRCQLEFSNFYSYNIHLRASKRLKKVDCFEVDYFNDKDKDNDSVHDSIHDLDDFDDRDVEDRDVSEDYYPTFRQLQMQGIDEAELPLGHFDRIENDLTYKYLQCQHYQNLFGTNCLYTNNMDEFKNSCLKLDYNDFIHYQLLGFGMKTKLSREAGNEMLQIMKLLKSDYKIPSDWRSITR